MRKKSGVHIFVFEERIHVIWKFLFSWNLISVLVSKSIILFKNEFGILNYTRKNEKKVKKILNLYLYIVLLSKYYSEIKFSNLTFPQSRKALYWDPSHMRENKTDSWVYPWFTHSTTPVIEFGSLATFRAFPAEMCRKDPKNWNFSLYWVCLH